MRRRARVVLTLVAFALVGCGGDDDPAASESSPTTADEQTSTTGEATTTTMLPPEEQAWADLQAGYAAFSAVAAEPDPVSPELTKYFTGESLAGVQSTMSDLQAGTGGSLNSVATHKYSISVAGETATVDYCFVDSSQHLDTAGNPTEELEVTHMRAKAQMQLIDGTWKLAQQTLTPEECPA